MSLLYEFDCPNCGSPLMAKRSAIGKRATCGECAQKIRIPDRESDARTLQSGEYDQHFRPDRGEPSNPGQPSPGRTLAPVQKSGDGYLKLCLVLGLVVTAVCLAFGVLKGGVCFGLLLGAMPGAAVFSTFGLFIPSKTLSHPENAAWIGVKNPLVVRFIFGFVATVCWPISIVLWLIGLRAI